MFFFFSSRRRHTRLQGDWSSDVCSSDLKAVPIELLGNYGARFTWDAAVLRFDSTQVGTFPSLAIIPDTATGGILRFNGTDALGKGGSLTLARVWFTAIGPGPSRHVLSLP